MVMFIIYNFLNLGQSKHTNFIHFQQYYPLLLPLLSLLVASSNVSSVLQNANRAMGPNRCWASLLLDEKKGDAGMPMTPWSKASVRQNLQS